MHLNNCLIKNHIIVGVYTYYCILQTYSKYIINTVESSKGITSYLDNGTKWIQDITTVNRETERH